jgi:hypothetical protein
MMLVHKNEKQAQRLINHLSNDFDVYVHIDKRVSLNIEKYENVFVYKRYKTYWGSFNLVIATLFLLRKAFERRYDRYILISGQDLPLKNNNEIEAFFTGNNNEYISLTKIGDSNVGGWDCMDRIKYYHVNRKYSEIDVKYKFVFRIQRKMFYILNKYFPRKLDYDFYGGSQWTSYTHNCVEKILEYLENDKKYIKRYRWTSCADEIFFQTIINQLRGINIVNNCLRYVDWQIGTLNEGESKILTLNDYDKITDSKLLFARKFDENIDKSIIEKIYEEIK